MANSKAEKKLTPVGQFGEFGLIKHLTKDWQHYNRSTIKGVGDDAAVIDAGEQYTVVSTDLLVEGIHFDLMYVPLKHLGYKSVIVNLSDIYAMNATPKQITVSIAMSSRFTVEALEQLYEGIETACRLYGVDLVGGDTSSSKKGMMISITAIGVVDKDKVVYRSGAKEGDAVFMSGDLGGAYLGLQLLEREKQIFLENPEIQPSLDKQEYLIGRQLKPEARKDIIDILDGMEILPTSMIDISDGLSSDVLHICEQSKVGCHIFEENLPLAEGTFNMALKFNINPITCVLNGGEDYELLFTVKQEDAPRLRDTFGISEIGKIVSASEGKKLISKSGNTYDLLAQGWQHH
ncbi:MAG: thiamine-phosphate kinase [Chitinophagales bacterium]